MMSVFFFKQKTAYEMRISDWSSVVCSSELPFLMLIFTLAALFALNHRPASARAETLLSMQVGEVRVLGLPDVARVAVGDGHVVNAVTTEDKEIGRASCRERACQ